MAISPAEAVAILARRLKRSSDEAERTAVAIRRHLPALVDVLVREFGVRKVLLFGSLLRGRAHLESDIDLAVQGLVPEQYFAALTRCTEVAGRNVDLVLLEEAGDALLEIVEGRGEVLYDS